jgi:putative transposase
MPDHVHLFIQADPFTAPFEIVRRIKSISAVYLFTKFPDLKKQKFWGSGLWSHSTYYNSVGHISEEMVKRYIDSQKHRKE